MCQYAFPSSLTGSPPPAWGIPLPLVEWSATSRFTPTCVGNTPIKSVLSPYLSVHPHLRGEYAKILEASPLPRGSPPPAWGIRLALFLVAGQGRFTPTCVGNTFDSLALHAVPLVHPHLRGEYRFSAFCLSVIFGSPPPAWGIRSRPYSMKLFKRFTPTCVGNTFLYAGLCVWLYGSPPPAWGILCRQYTQR